MPTKCANEPEVWFQTIVWSRFYCDADSFRLALFGVPISSGQGLRHLKVSDKAIPNGLIDVSPSEPRQGIVELGDESIPVILGHAHECPTHDDELDLTGG